MSGQTTRAGAVSAGILTCGRPWRRTAVHDRAETRAVVLGETIAAVLALLARTWRVARLAPDRTAGVLPGACGVVPRPPAPGRRLFVFCHGDAVLAAGTHRRLAPATLASWHRDGAMVARALARLGYPVVRGSTRRGGTGAMFALARLAREGRDLAVTPDGPLGPPGSVGRGTVDLARRARLSIVPVGFGVSRALSLPTWDRCLIAPPGARVVVVYGDPVPPPDANAAAAEAARREVARRLESARRLARRVARGEQAIA